MRKKQPSHEYPRPQLVRKQWTSLNGPWDFAIDPAGSIQSADDLKWARQITVPFAPETPASGIGDTSFCMACWYRREFDRPAMEQGHRLILHFGAVDWSARVWVNGKLAAEHEGGYTPFSADITDLLSGSGKQTITLRAEDDPHDLAKPRGKQDWQLEPHAIWYPRTTGVWQTVWMEVVPATRIASLRWSANVEKWEISLTAKITGPQREGTKLRVKLSSKGKVLADDSYAVSGECVRRTISLSDPGIDNARYDLLWTTWQPNLIQAEIELADARGEVIDAVSSYTALRTVGTIGNFFALNGHSCQLRLVLDQGYWPESGLTPPDDDAIKRDIELTKAMGFNGVRKHQKIEDPRFLYWADVMGLLVWEECPGAYQFSDVSVRRLTRMWAEVIERDASHPCIVAWVPFNESWGVPDLPASKSQRHYLAAIYHLTKTLDPTRPVIGNDGWENPATDIVGVHDYERTPAQLIERYALDGQSAAHVLGMVRPAGRMLCLDDSPYLGQPIMLTEFGGIAFSKAKGSWGYKRAESSQALSRQYTELLAAVRSVPIFAGFCYTQLTDTYQEANGLLTMDRKPKVPLKQLKEATALA